MTINVVELEIIINDLEQLVQNHIVDMSEYRIKPNELNYPCGTPGCHAGWLGLACGLTSGNYINGAQVFATRIGFYCDLEVEMTEWFSDHPHIWGNNYGYEMFCLPEALGQTEQRFPATVLVDHWRGVIDRLTDWKTKANG